MLSQCVHVICAHRDPLAQSDLQVNLGQTVPLVFLAHLDLLVHQEVVVNLVLVDRVEEMEKRERRVSAGMLYCPFRPYNRII